MKRGFTLIELLVSTALLAAIMVAVGACLAAGLRVLDGTREFGATEAKAQAGLILLGRDLMNTFPFRGAVFKGSADQVSMAGMVLPASGESGKAEVREVSYRFDPRHRTIRRSVRGGVHTPLDADPSDEAIIEHAREFTVLYRSARISRGGEPPWQEQWNNASNLPEQVKVELLVETRHGPVPYVRSFRLAAAAPPQ